MRERGASSALPPLYFLHVWWARRPLTASRAAILASVLPTWSPKWPKSLLEQFPTEDGYHAWFLRLCGILGDPVYGRKLIIWAKDKGVKLKVPPYPHKRAFTVSPSPEYIKVLGDLLEHTWGTRFISVLDSFAGGGSIPFESRRYGFETYANELNPIASVVLKATLDYPFRFGSGLSDDIRKYGKLLADVVQSRLAPFYPIEPGESIQAYVWARTINCPYTGKPIPLCPNWWLFKGSDPVAIRATFDPSATEARFEILTGGVARRSAPDKGTVKKGSAVSPWANNQPVDGAYIKAEAQAGRMGAQMMAIAFKRGTSLSFRTPSDHDREAVLLAREAVAKRELVWASKDLLPSEGIGEGTNYDRGHRLYGMEHWRDMFAPRQLLANVECLSAMRDVLADAAKTLPPERLEALATCFALALDKAVDRNAYAATWIAQRAVIGHVFQKHNFSIRWSFAEFDAARNLVPWSLEQIADSYSGLAKLADTSGLAGVGAKKLGSLTLLNGNASELIGIEAGSISLACVDPPYYDNVMYAECSDFFYVWQKRLLSSTFPSLYVTPLTNKDDEAVANYGRFSSMGSKKKAHAGLDYQRKMSAAFRELNRVLADNGVLSVMFTHKKVDAWDSLASSLIGAGFSIAASWPVRTEFANSLHVAKTNSAESTIVLVCRKRSTRAEAVWWDDIKGQVKRVARDTASAMEKQGLRGVDLYIATFGPTLAILSENWPVLTSEVDEKTGNPKPLRPEVALDLARSEVVSLRKQDLLLGRTVQFDKSTDWYIMAWDAFRAAEFRADEALKLALALDLDLERDVVGNKRLIRKKQSTVVLNTHIERRKKDMVDGEKKSFDCWIDAAHTAMLLYAEDGANVAEQFLRRAGLRQDSTFKALIQALLNAIPLTKIKGKFARPEAEVLEAMRLAFFEDLQMPVEKEPALPAAQMALPMPGSEGESESDEDEDEELDDEDEESE